MGAGTASIVITNYNYGRFVAEAIDSALAQRGDDVEVIVVDDGSTDGSREVIASYGDRVVPVLQGNGGHASATNAGFEATSGEIVCFLDADDTIAPDTMGRALAMFEAAPFAKLHWPLAEVDVAGRPLGRIDPPAPLDEGDLRERVVARGPGAYVTPPTSGNAYSRAFLEQVMPVPEEIRMCADAYLYDLAPLYGPIARLQEPHGTYRQHPDRNFGARPFDERLPKSAFVHELLIPRLAERCRELGIQPDERSWAQRSWPLRSFRALTDIDGLVPSSTPFVLVDDGKLGVNATPTRRLIPFPPSPSDDVALAELERLRPAGAEFLVVAWPAFSWFDQSRLARHLRSSHRLVLENEQVIAFALGALGAPRPRRG